MALLALVMMLIILFFYDKKIFVYGLMVFYVLFDMLDGFYEDEKIFAAIRYIVPLIFITYFIITENALRKKDTLFLLLILYLLVLLVYSDGDMLISAKATMAILLSLMMIPVGRYLGRQTNLIKEFEGYNRFLLIALPLYIITANILNFGESYSDSFTTGFLVTSRFYIIPIVVFLAIHYNISSTGRDLKTKMLDIAFIVLNVCIILINTRRTALAMLIMAIVIYTILNRKIAFRMALLSVFLVSALIISYPLYEDRLEAQLEKRERIKDIDTYEEEARFLETFYILDHHSRNQRVNEILFGVKLFDTFEFGNQYFGRDRPIHSDINMVIFSTGIVGALLFAVLVLQHFFSGLGRIAPENRKLYYPLLAMFLIILIPGRFIGTMTFAPLLMLLLSAVKAHVPEYVLFTIKRKGKVLHVLQ